MMKKRSKLLDNPPAYGSRDWGLYQYERKKEANVGHNYQYYNHERWKDMEKKGWRMLKILDHWGQPVEYTASEHEAQEQVSKLRSEGNHARIIAGYHQTVQHTKFFTVIYRPKK